MELKTLKDIVRECDTDWDAGVEYVVVHLLRQEAIKWVKLLKAEDNDDNLYMNGYCLEHMKVDNCLDTLGISWAECGDIIAVVNFLKHFFNITEEELE